MPANHDEQLTLPLSHQPQATELTRSLQPPLKWAGGKRWQLPILRHLWELSPGYRLVEPFCGGLAVALGLTPERALLNDINPHLINFYRWVKRGLRIELPLKNDSAMYYAYRDKFNALVKSGLSDSAEAAGLFYYLNRTGYNGLCRFNSEGLFNVPCGQYVTIKYRHQFVEYKDLFSKWSFLNYNFEFLELSSDDFVYADPPYDVAFRQYSKDGFNWSQQVRVAEWLSKHPGPVILSNQATGRIVDLYKTLDFELRFLIAPRRISSDGNRTPAPEVLALRNIVMQDDQQPVLQKTLVIA